ncbi:MAG: PilZ domain-containing protein [Acidobacteriota bacterium]
MPLATATTPILLAGDFAVRLAEDPSILTLYSPFFLTTRDGREALMLLMRQRPRLAIVDSPLPELDGEAIVARVREHRELRHTSTILVRQDGRSGRSAANVTLDMSAGYDGDALIRQADRLLSIKPRYRAKAWVRIDRPSVQKFGAVVQTLNLSESGMLVASRDLLHVGEAITLRVLLPRVTQTIGARVVREAPADAIERSEHRYGVEFTALLPEDRLKIRSCIELLSPAPAMA